VNVLASVPGEHIARAAAELPDAASAANDLHYVEIKLPPPDGRRILLTFRRFKRKHRKSTKWFWSAQEAEVIG
jgi:hypothetical protein